MLKKEETVASEEPTHANIILEFEMNERVYQELERLTLEPGIDIILVPLEVKEAFDNMDYWCMESDQHAMYLNIAKKLRVELVKDNVLMIAYHNKFRM